MLLGKRSQIESDVNNHKWQWYPELIRGQDTIQHLSRQSIIVYSRLVVVVVVVVVGYGP